MRSSFFYRSRQSSELKQEIDPICEHRRISTSDFRFEGATAFGFVQAEMKTFSSDVVIISIKLKSIKLSLLNIYITLIWWIYTWSADPDSLGVNFDFRASWFNFEETANGVSLEFKQTLLHNEFKHVDVSDIVVIDNIEVNIDYLSNFLVDCEVVIVIADLDCHIIAQGRLEI